jgi:hypothetical protein
MAIIQQEKQRKVTRILPSLKNFSIFLMPLIEGMSSLLTMHAALGWILITQASNSSAILLNPKDPT